MLSVEVGARRLSTVNTTRPLHRIPHAMPGESPCRRRYLDLGYWFPGGGVARKCSPRGKWKNTIGAYVQPNGARWAGAPPPYLLPSSQQPGHPCLPEALYDEIFTRYPSAPHEVSGPPNTTITTAQRQQHRRPRGNKSTPQRSDPGQAFHVSSTSHCE